MASTDVEGRPAADTRARLIGVAVDLFTRHSFAGTSLQMIADHIGFTKAAIYHHFRTREQLLLAVLEPLLEELRTVVDAAEAKRSVNARADRMLTGYATLAVRNRGLVGVLAADPSVASTLEQRAEWTQLIARQLSLLADVDPQPAGKVKAVMVFAGMAAAAGPASAELDDDELRAYLIDAGRRTLGVRAPRRREKEQK
ncbi:TetR/AcrR family transcriptional regulator [Mycolicibacterium pyrenivorans]|uniref:TetR/AcrR family transcriptional regulator n=1 Tax=Mycolicibacterium pyrenivorans TaxID=187102 RepID=UPI0021F2FF02|nr:TetR/AcrR family transcriptional regulator [Mycolicibacterium pyrenivorans]MCV7151033.1 TetR/AcrR family transcriptional regulator [Mycolicibacterium pyrenivorans]